MLRDRPKDDRMSAKTLSHQPRLVVTDLMGTTLRDDGAVLPAYRAAFAECAIPFTEEELAAKRGAHKLSLFTEFAARRYAADDAAKGGAEDAIRRLCKAGIKVALTSGFDRGLIADIVKHCGWGELFDAVVYPDEVPAGRPAPYLIFQAMQKTRVEPVKRVAAIGDTALRVQAGTNAGAGWVIGVLSGAADGATLGRTPHTHLLPSIAELPSLFGIA